MKKTIILLTAALFVMVIFSMAVSSAGPCANPDVNQECCESGDLDGGPGPLCFVTDDDGNDIGSCYRPNCDGFACCSGDTPFGRTKYKKDGDDCITDECSSAPDHDKEECQECYNYETYTYVSTSSRYALANFLYASIIFFSRSLNSSCSFFSFSPATSSLAPEFFSSKTFLIVSPDLFFCFPFSVSASILCILPSLMRSLALFIPTV